MTIQNASGLNNDIDSTIELIKAVYKDTLCMQGKYVFHNVLRAISLCEGIMLNVSEIQVNAMKTILAKVMAALKRDDYVLVKDFLYYELKVELEKLKQQ